MIDHKKARQNQTEFSGGGFLALLCRFVVLWLQERMYELLPITLGHGIPDYTVSLWPFFFWQMMRAEKPVVDREMRRVIDINRSTV